MPNIRDSQIIVTGDGRRTIPDTGEDYIAQGIKSVANSLDNIADKKLKVVNAKKKQASDGLIDARLTVLEAQNRIDNGRAIKSTAQQINAKNIYNKQNQADLRSIAEDQSIANRDVEDVLQSFDNLDAERRQSIFENINFYDENDQTILNAELTAQSQSIKNQILMLHSDAVVKQANNIWMNSANELSREINGNPTPGTLFGTIYELKSQSEKLAESIGPERMQLALRDQTAGMVGFTVKSLVDKKQFDAASALINGEWVDPTTNNLTSFDNIIGPEGKAELSQYIELGLSQENELAIQGLAQSVDLGQAGKAEIEVFKKNRLIDGQQSQDLISLAEQRAEETEAQQRRFDLVEQNRVTGRRLELGSPDSQLAVDEYFAGILSNQAFTELPLVEQNQRIIDLVDQTGFLPKTVRTDLYRDIMGGEQGLLRAADLLSQIEELDFPVVSDIPDQNLSRIRVINNLLASGLEPEIAVERATTITDPTNHNQIEARERAYEKSDFRSAFFIDGPGDLSNIPIPQGSRIPPHLNDQLLNEIQGLEKREYLMTGDLFHSREYAKKMISKSWGVSRINGSNEFMKYPPEKYYGFGENKGWIEQKFKDDFAKSGIPEEVEVFLVSDQRTGREALVTGQPTYKLQFKTPRAL